METDEYVDVSSPGYPRFYPDNLDMTLHFIATDNGSFAINIHELALVVIAEYYYDYFTIGFGGNSSTGTVVLEEDVFVSPDTTFVLPEREIWIRLLTGNKYRSRGFLATVKRIQNSGEIGIKSSPQSKNAVSAF